MSGGVFRYPGDMGVVYGLRLIGDDRIRYVGKTIRKLSDRMSGHRHAAFADRDDRPISHWIRKHGRFSFEPVVLAESEDWDTLSNIEIQFIDSLRTYKDRGGLNVTLGGDGSLGTRRTPEQVEAQRKAVTGRRASVETRERMRLINLGAKRSASARKSMSESAKKRVRNLEDIERIRQLGRKLTDAQEDEILSLLAQGMKQREVGALYGITQSGVSNLKRRRALVD